MHFVFSLNFSSESTDHQGSRFPFLSYFLPNKKESYKKSVLLSRRLNHPLAFPSPQQTFQSSPASTGCCPRDQLPCHLQCHGLIVETREGRHRIERALSLKGTKGIFKMRSINLTRAPVSFNLGFLVFISSDLKHFLASKMSFLHSKSRRSWSSTTSEIPNNA